MEWTVTTRVCLPGLTLEKVDELSNRMNFYFGILCRFFQVFCVIFKIFLPRFLRNLYAGQEATVRTRHGTMNCFKIGKGVHQGCILLPCLFNFYEEYIMLNAWLDEAQAGIKTSRKNINNLRYPDDTTLIAESQEKLKSLS